MKPKNFSDEIQANPPKKDYVPKKIDVFFIDRLCSINLLNLNDYGTEKQKL